MHCNGQQKALVKRKRKTRVPDKSASAVQVPSSISPEQSLSTVTELGSIKCRQPRVRVSPIDGGSKGVARVPFGADVSAGRGGPAVPPPVAALPPLRVIHSHIQPPPPRSPSFRSDARGSDSSPAFFPIGRPSPRGFSGCSPPAQSTERSVVASSALPPPPRRGIASADPARQSTGGSHPLPRRNMARAGCAARTGA
ncbi:hypothetical protein HPB51_015202 [Rhipicephalus microplus]|uniref:Uncharacterized protein n=1 Tax=Rhipicephalus microplus TaxID=6941 RepID=A0A9J6D9X6_RHIMP|nr:hypothetical protein HPB51_015202 [Rhipicephalus microplus]